MLSLSDSPGGWINGGLYHVDDWNELDAREGVRTGKYARIAVPVLVAFENVVHCHEFLAATYVTKRPGNFVEPDERYLQICYEGREKLKLPTNDLRLAAIDKCNGFGDGEVDVFTYGTLCRGESHERLMRSADFLRVSLAKIRNMAIRIHASGGYPCMLPANTNLGESQVVVGDLWTYRVADLHANALSDLLAGLDAWEQDHRPTLRYLARIAQNHIDEGLDVGQASLRCREFLRGEMSRSLFRRTFFHPDYESPNRPAWTYLYNREEPNLLPITSNNWRKYTGRWDGFLRSLAEAYIRQAGGIDAIRAAAADCHFSSRIANPEVADDLARRLDTGAVEERELIVKLGLQRFRA